MRTKKSKWLLLVSLACILVLGLGAGYSASQVRADESIAPIIDNAESVQGPKRDAWQIGVQGSDVGFGADSRHNSSIAPAPTSTPTEASIANNEHSYIEYNVAGHNLAHVTADYDPAQHGRMDDIIAIAFLPDGGTFVTQFLEVNNKALTSSANWARIKFSYILPEDTAFVRFVFTSYENEAAGVNIWAQQITKVEIVYTDNLPAKDKPAVYVDNIDSGVVLGQRSDVYNISVLNDDATKVGDMNRMIFGTSGQESYIDYDIINQDTVVVTAYERVLTGNVRPADVKEVKFSLFGVNWETSATSTNVEIGSYSNPERWTRITYTYKLPEGVMHAKMRVHIYVNTPQDVYQVGRVEIFNSTAEDPEVESVSSAFEVSTWLNIPDIGVGLSGSSNLIVDSVQFDREMKRLYASGVNVNLPYIWGGNTLEYTHRLLNSAQANGVQTLVYDPALNTALANGNQSLASSLVESYKDHPAFRGHFIQDEPSRAEVNGWAAASALYKTILPGKTFYINLLPYYGPASAYNKYVEDIDNYFTKLDLDYVCFDYYALQGFTEAEYTMKTTFLQNLDLLAKKAETNNAKLFTILNTTGHYNPSDLVYLRKPTSIADISFQAYTAMAYGTKGITWFTYLNMGESAYGVQNGMIDTVGKETDAYGYVRTVNNYIHSYSDVYLGYNWTGTLLKEGLMGGANPSFNFSGALTSHASIVNSVASQDIIIGTFADGSGKTALMVVNYNDPALKLTSDVSLTFDKRYDIVAYKDGSSTSIVADGSNKYSFNLAAGEGVFLTLDEGMGGAKAEAIDELNSYADGKGSANYSAANWQQITGIVASATTAINQAADETGVLNAVNTAKADIDGVATLAQELAAYKTGAIGQLDSYYGGFDLDNYSPAGVTQLGEMLEYGKGLINSAATTSAVDTALADAKSALDSVPDKYDTLSEAKAQAVAELNGYMPNGRTEADYSAAGKGLIAQARGAGVSNINAATTEQGVADALNSAKTAIDNVATIAQEAQTLLQAKTDAKAELAGYASAKGEVNYSAHNWNKIAGEVTAGNAAIDAADELSNVAAALSQYKTRIDAVHKLTEGLEPAKLTARNELKAYLAGLTEADYSADNWSDINGIYAEAVADIDEATEAVYITAAKTNAVEEMGQVPTLTEEFAAFKTSKKAELDQYATQKVKSNYSDAKWEIIEQYVANAKAAIDSAEDYDGVNTAVSEAKTAIDGVLTRAQESQIALDEAKVTAKQALEQYATDKGQDKYTEQNWAVITKAVTDGKAAIDAAVSSVRITQELTAAKAAIDAVEVKPTTPDEKPDDKKGNTTAIVVGVSMGVAALVGAGAVVIIIRRKRMI